jgi:RNA polymerase sigma-70 factor (ECF subfamily)
MSTLPSASLRFEQWRPYLRMLARIQIESRLQAKIDASDIVQQTMFEAHQARAQFRGTSDDDLRAWLRRILARNLADEIRKYRCDKRNAGLERSLNKALDESSAGLGQCLLAQDDSPVEVAMRNERLVHLASAIDSLPSDQRQAVWLHHVEGRTAAQIAIDMERTEVSVAGLLRRGLKTLRQSMNREQSE